MVRIYLCIARCSSNLKYALLCKFELSRDGVKLRENPGIIGIKVISWSQSRSLIGSVCKVHQMWAILQRTLPLWENFDSLGRRTPLIWEVALSYEAPSSCPSLISGDLQTRIPGIPWWNGGGGRQYLGTFCFGLVGCFLVAKNQTNVQFIFLRLYLENTKHISLKMKALSSCQLLLIWNNSGL